MRFARVAASSLLCACGAQPGARADDSSSSGTLASTSAASGDADSTTSASTSADPTTGTRADTSSSDSTGGPACGGTDLPETRLTTSADPAIPRENITQWNWGRCIAADDDGGVHVVWTQLGSTSIEYAADVPDPIDAASLPPGQILYLHSSDCGERWSAPLEITAPTVGTDSAGVATAGAQVFVVWRELLDARWVVHFRASTDRGASWGEPIAISDNPDGIAVSAPSIAASQGGSIAVVWADGRPRMTGSGSATTKEIQLVYSADAGTTWDPVRTVSTPDGFSSWTPAVAIDGTAVHVAWTDERHDVGECTLAPNPCREEEYYRRSDDGGATWGPEQRLTMDAPGAERESWAPSIAVANGRVHVAFFDRRTDRFAVYTKRSPDGGDSWDDDVLLSVGFEATDAARPTIAARDDAVEVAWFSYADFPAVVHRNRSQDGGDTWSDPIAVTADDPTIAARIPHVAIGPNGDTHVIWYDTRNSDATGAKVEIYYARAGG